MDFNKQFPSLKGKEVCGIIENNRCCLKNKDSTQHNEEHLKFNFWFYSEENIEKYCLDKQRIREAIGDINIIKPINGADLNFENQVYNVKMLERFRILRELNLDEM